MAMSISLRRALFCSRNLFYTLGTASIHSHPNYSSIEKYFHECVAAEPDRLSGSRFYQFNTRRGFANGSQQQQLKKEEEAEEDKEEIEDYNEDVIEHFYIDPYIEFKDRAGEWVSSAVGGLKSELDQWKELLEKPTSEVMLQLGTGLRDLYPSSKFHIIFKELDSNTVSLTPHPLMFRLYNIKPPEVLKRIEKAILSSPLGLKPKSEEERLVVTIGPWTEEQLQAVRKMAEVSIEEAKEDIIQYRAKAIRDFELRYVNQSLVSKSFAKLLTKELDKSFKGAIIEVENLYGDFRKFMVGYEIREKDMD